MLTCNLRHLSILTISFLLLTANAKADVIITVDVSNVEEVIFSTTDAFAEGTFEGSAVNGITLKDFFTGNSFTVTGASIASDITVFDAADQSSQRVLDTLWVANFFTGGYTPNDISFYDPFNEPIFIFDDQRALTGSASLSLAEFSGLPSIGTTGDVYFDAPNENQIIGQWQIIGVPEPSSSIILSVGLLLVLRRRK